MVSHGVTKNVNLPILNNVLIRIIDKTVRFTTTNLEIAVTATLRGKVDDEGEFTVPSKLFSDYVSLLSNDRVDVELINDSIAIESLATKTKIKGIPASEFPLIPKLDSTIAYRLPVADFRRALGRVIFAVSTNESRPELSGVLMKFEPTGPSGSLLLAATDSYRLSEARVPLHEGSGSSERSVIVPVRTMAEIARILGAFKESGENRQTLEIVVADNQILFLYDSIELISRTIDGKYPDYRAIIPESAKTTITVSRDELQKGVKASALFTRSGINDVQLIVDSALSKLTLRSSDSQTGENESVLLGEIAGIDNAVTLNFRYLLDGINAIDGDRVSLKLVDGAVPCLLEPANELKNYLYIVMPIRQ